MAQNKIVTDENLMESAKHGTDSYPFKCYFEKLSQFDFYCIDWHWHTEWEFVYVASLFLNGHASMIGLQRTSINPLPTA